MTSGFIWDELTETHSITVIEFPREKEYVAEVFIKDEGFVWYSVKRYSYLPTKSIIFRDTYAMNCKSPRPYKPGQACDGSITAPALHLYAQMCKALQSDPIALYSKAYEDSIFTEEQLSEIIRFAEWQGVEVIYDWNSSVMDLVLESLHEINYHQLANVLDEYIPI
jgi:hypothetical protein